MAVCVKSEIGALKKVLLQRPGRELEHLSPNTLEELLFDDIPYLYGAQQEHDCFAAILREQGRRSSIWKISRRRYSGWTRRSASRSFRTLSRARAEAPSAIARR